jgi:hypothetical protein
MVRVVAPTTAELPADSVIVLCPLPGAPMLVGAKLAVTPLGRPLTDSAMAALKPAPPAVVTVMGIDPPRAIPALLALRERVKALGTVRARL